MKSRVHPKNKTKYRVANWPEYDQALARRGDISLWVTPEAIAAWAPGGPRRRGGQLRYSDLAIETALILRLVFHLPLRQVEGFMRSLFGLLGLDLPVPDHTTLSRRGRHLDLKLRHVLVDEPVHLIVDSTGLTIVGEGEWAAAKHGGKGTRGWRKLHLGVDGTGVIVAQVLTGSGGDDAATVPEILDQVDGEISRFAADSAYDSRAVYSAAMERGAEVVIPPMRSARTGARPR